MLAGTCIAAEQQKEVSQEVTNPDVNAIKPSDSGLAWTKVQMTDAVTGEQFSIDELAKQGKTIILHTFAVWCPACTMQFLETGQLLTADPDAFTIVGIDLDPNENQDMVKRHVEKNKFPGRYVSAPRELTQGIVGTFGPGYALELPQTTIVCSRTVNHLGSGLFREQTLKSALGQVCT
jgi:thiol-disulfide isomerase/thioredoxin